MERGKEGEGRVTYTNEGNERPCTVRHHALQHGDRNVTIDYCDVTSPYAYVYRASIAYRGKNVQGRLTKSTVD